MLPKFAQKNLSGTAGAYRIHSIQRQVNQRCAGIDPAIFPIYVLNPTRHLIQYERTETSLPFTLGGDSEMVKNQVEAGPSE